MTATPGRAPASAGSRSSRSRGPAARARTLRAATRHRARRSGLLLLATATLLLIPVLAYADVPVATISGPVSVAEGQTGGAVYTVTLEGGTGSADIVFDYTVTGTVSESDYTDDATVAGKLTLEESGGTTPASGTITLQIPDDGIDEVPETLIVTLTKVTTEAGMVAIGSPNSVTTTVLPAATETVSFASAAVTAAEDAPGGLEFTVNLTEDISDDVVVRYDVLPGTASPSDYTSDSSSGTETITVTTASFSVMPVNDMLAEDSETFTVRLSLVNPPENVALGIATATGTITDNDDVAATVTANPKTIVEGSVATFTVDLGVGDVAGSEDVVVTYHTEPDTADTRPAGTDDYEAPDGTLIVPAGATMGSISIQTNPDELLEGVETLRVTLTDVRSEAGTNAAGDSTVGLANQDTTDTAGIGDPDSTILVSVEDGAATEGSPVTLIVRLSGKVSGSVTVPYDLDGGTAEANDYTDSPTPVEIPTGMTTGTISVPTTNDSNAEDAETFMVTLLQTGLTSPQGVTVALGDTTATATINDNDPLTVTVTGADRVREGDPATFTVNLNGGMGSTPVTVDYTVTGTATKGTDYVDPEEKTLVINPEGTLTLTSGIITIQTRQDSEADETLVVTLTNPRTDEGSVTLGTPSEARSTLVAQDTVIISVADSASVPEAQTANASFAVTADRAISGVKLRYETVAGTATFADFTATTNTVDISDADPDNAPDISPITVAVTNDALAEGPETFTLSLSLVGAPDNVVLATTSAKATITDEDADDLTVRVASEEGSVEEGSEANFPVTLTGTSTAAVVVKYAVVGIDPDNTGPKEAAEKEDYEVPGDSVTIPAGTNTATITIPIVADELLEPTETLQVTLMSPTTEKGMVTLDADADDTTTDIIPQAQDTVTASLATTAVTVTEGGKASFPVVLSGKVAGELAVAYTIAAGATNGATGTGDNADYSTATPQQVVFKEGETRAVIEVNTTPDTRAENNETFTVTLTPPTHARHAGGEQRDVHRDPDAANPNRRVAGNKSGDGYDHGQ